MNSKETALYELILDLWKKSTFNGSLNLSTVFIECKKKGIYTSTRLIGEKMKMFADKGLISVDNWNIIQVKTER